MNRRKIIRNVILSAGSGILLFFYFYWLNNLGAPYRKELREEAFIKSDTLFLHAKFHLGDDPQWAAPEFNDSAWTTIRTDSIDNYQGEIAWFRFHIHEDNPLLLKPVSIFMVQYGASDIYLNGTLLTCFGKVASDKKKEIPMKPDLPVSMNLKKKTPHTIAVRYSNYHFPEYKEKYGSSYPFPGFRLFFQNEGSAADQRLSNQIGIIVTCVLGIFLLTLSFVHFLLYLFYKKARENLFYTLFSFFYSLFFIFLTFSMVSSHPAAELTIAKLMILLTPFFIVSLLLFVLRVYHIHFPKWLWYCVAAASAVILSDILNWADSLLIAGAIVWLIVLAVFTMASGTYNAFRNKIPGVNILGTGMIIFALFIFVILSLTFYTGNISITGTWSGIGMIMAMLSVPISMSVYLAWNSAATNHNLEKKLIEVENLSARSIAQEKEKQEILARQKENLEIQVTERTREVVQQKKVIEEKNKDITDSINYAKRIQDAILPSEEQIKKMLPDSFVLFKPKDIVSGDFYFFAEADGKVIAAAVDCTGHGVPGGFMSMVGHNHLKRIVNEQKITDTSKILDELHKQVLHSLNRDISRRDSKDGMDAAIVSIDKQKREVQFSGAVRPLYYFMDGNLIEVKGERYSIAGIKEIDGQPYSSTTLSPDKPATFYLLSDGFADQFGGKEGKKLMSKNLRELLVSIQDKSLEGQKQFLDSFFEEWRAGKEQMDDVMVIGIKI